MVDRQARVRAPELVGAGGWINTGGRSLTLKELRGKIVLLDFWTFCCINCLHVLDELREVEAELADVLVVIGVHSPKFVHEADHAAVLDAVERYEVHHAVLDDPELVTWKQYAVRAWPTLVVVDPEGYVVTVAAGEGHGPGIASLVRELVVEHEAKGTLHRGSGIYVAPPPPATALRFPGKVIADGQGGFWVSDTGHKRVVRLAADAETVLETVEGFAEPQGLCLLPDGRLLVADTVAHQLLLDGKPVAGTGVARHVSDTFYGAALDTALSSPWDVCWWPECPGGPAVVIAGAGTHQLWAYDPTGGPDGTGTVRHLAGTGAEGLRDGQPEEAWFAQPSGLAVGVDGRLWVADAETSALRWLDPAGEVHHAVGLGLFDFGHRDGPGADALLQHPLGVAVLPDGSIAICDTYNKAVRRYDPVTDEVTTLATDVAEPSGAVFANGSLFVVESAAHRVTRPLTPGAEKAVSGPAHRTARPSTAVAPGELLLDVVFTAPPGQKIDDRWGPSTRLVVSSTPPELLLAGSGNGVDLRRPLVLADGIASGVLHVTATAASCDDDGQEFPSCHITTQDWGIPVDLVPGAATRLPLMLRGLDAG